MAPSLPPRVAELIRTLALVPHPEGGHFAEVFRSSGAVRPAGRDVSRAALTSIYFLLAAGEHSRWHRVAADEAWHFYEGDPLELFWVDDRSGACVRRRLGAVAAGGAAGDTRPVEVVPAGAWQAARPTGAYALVGCTVGPGFDFRDFTLLADVPSEAERLGRRFPELAGLI